MSETVPTQDQVAKSILGIVEAVWEDSKQPVLIAALPPLIERDIGDYDEALKGIGLFRFTQTRMADVVDAVRHPMQRSKVGLVPKGEKYEFPLDGSGPKRNVVIKNLMKETREKPSNPTKLDELIAILGELSEEDLRLVNIPIHILVKLAK